MEPVRYIDRSKSTASLVGDLLENVQKLVSQEISLGRAEVKKEYRRFKAFFYIRMLYSLAGLFALVLFTLSLVELLFSMQLAAWAVYGLVGLIFSTIALLLWGILERNLSITNQLEEPTHAS